MDDLQLSSRQERHVRAATAAADKRRRSAQQKVGAAPPAPANRGYPLDVEPGPSERRAGNHRVETELEGVDDDTGKLAHSDLDRSDVRRLLRRYLLGDQIENALGDAEFMHAPARVPRQARAPELARAGWLPPPAAT